MRVLIADDEKNLRESLAEYLALDGIEAFLAQDGASAKRALQEEAFDAAVLDLRMPPPDGIALLRWIRESGPDIPVIMVSAHGELRDAVEAMKLGAIDYLSKPFDPEELAIRLQKAVRARANAGLEAGARSADRVEFLGESPAALAVMSLVRKVAPVPSTVLITGESGTGKEIAARSIHRLSGRTGPFVPVNLGALPEELAESELFGHEKGAFTGASGRKIGLFEAAHGGTLFLDEAGELSLRLQVKLLRAIQERRIQRVGGVTTIPIDARIIAATNRDLEKEVASGAFREDLYYRLNVIRIRMPPLRERREDIALLVDRFMARLSREIGKKVDGLAPEALGALESYPFPGNVRELENMLERALIMCEGRLLQIQDLGLEARLAMNQSAAQMNQGAAPTTQGAVYGKALDEAERAAILAALERNAWHREKSAAELGITRRTLLTKMKEYGLSRA